MKPDFHNMTLQEQRLLTPEQLPPEVIRTWNEWLTNFDESTQEKKAANSTRLQAHFDACKVVGIDSAAVATIMKLGKK
jgi:hypothetical protein